MPSGLRWYSTSWVDPENGQRKKIKDLTDTELLDRLKVYESKKILSNSLRSAPFVYINLLKEAINRGLRQEFMGTAAPQYPNDKSVKNRPISSPPPPIPKK